MLTDCFGISLLLILFSSFLSYFQTRIVSCIGTDADNIRPAQRALQLFKNQTFLALLMGSGPTTGAQGFAKDNKNALEESTDLVKQAGEESLRMLLPALFRGGQLCWNPTVNKMTGLALNNLKVICFNFVFFFRVQRMVLIFVVLLFC